MATNKTISAAVKKSLKDGRDQAVRRAEAYGTSFVVSTDKGIEHLTPDQARILTHMPSKKK